jgi:hypothetical protein
MSKQYHIIYETINVTKLFKHDTTFSKHDQITEDHYRLEQAFQAWLNPSIQGARYLQLIYPNLHQVVSSASN